MQEKDNKTCFIIVRVTKTEKDKLKSESKKNSKKFSVFIRFKLGL